MMEAELPDGRILEFPDGTPPEVVQATVKKVLAQSPVAQPQVGVGQGPGRPESGALGYGKAAGSGLAEGLMAATVGAPGDMSDLRGTIQKAVGEDPNSINNIFAKLNPINAMASMMPTTPEISKAVGTDYKPKNAGERYTKEIMAGGSSMGIGGGGVAALMKRFLAGGSLGAAGEAGSTAMGGEDGSFLGRIAAQSPLLAALGYASMRKPNVAKASQDVLKEVGPDRLKEASGKANEAAETLAAPTLLSQGLSERTGVSALTQELLNTPQGSDMRKILQQQEGAAKSKIDQFIDSFAGQTNQDQANRIGGSVQKALDQPDKNRAAVVNPLYEKAASDQMSADGLMDLASKLEDEANILGRKSAGARPLLKMAKDLRSYAIEPRAVTPGGEALLGPDGKVLKADIDVSKVELLASEAKAKLRAIQAKDPSSATITPGSERGLGAAGVIANTATGEVSPTLARARIVGKEHHTGEMADVKRSPLTDMAPDRKTGKAEWEDLFKVFDQSPKDVKYITERMRDQDPGAVAALTRAYFERGRDTAAKVVDGRQSPTLINDFIDNSVGAKGTTKRAAALEMVEAANGPEARAAADKLFDALEVVARERQGVAKGTADMKELSGVNLASTALKTASFAGGWPMGKGLQNAVHRASYTKLAKALTSPEGVQELIKLAQWDRAGNAFKQMARGILSVNAQEQAAQ